MIERIIGIGASAGGLEVLLNIISAIERSERACYIIAQHISSHGHTDLIVKALNRHSKLQVISAHNETVLESDKIYLIPAGVDGVVDQGKMTLEPPKTGSISTPSINTLFNSMAQVYKDKAIAVVLSGAGSDGALGCVEIKKHGGLTIAQSPTSSVFNGIPTSAIDTGKIDHILDAVDIAKFIAHVLTPQTKNGHPRTEDHEIQNNENISSLIAMIKEYSGVDFSLYREETIQRRLEHRISKLKLDGLKSYLNYIKTSQDELKIIQECFCVSLSYFFRDYTAFLALQKSIEINILKKNSNESFVVWVAGCANGEESYSIGIIISNILKKHNKSLSIEIISIDLNTSALRKAQNGFYTKSALKDVSKEIISEYFIRTADGFSISKKIKRYCSFHHQNIFDFKINNVDLISCRNLLIYFKRTTQNVVIDKFRKSLINRGILFLGQSEKIGQEYEKYFEAYDQDNKIFILK